MWSLDSIIATAIQTINQAKLLMKQSAQGLIGADSKLSRPRLRDALFTVSSEGLIVPINHLIPPGQREVSGTINLP